MFDISDLNFVRTLRPFSDLQDPTDTIYDHLPYKKDINIINENSIRLESGNVVKYVKLDVNKPFVIDTNELAEIIIDEENALHTLESARFEQGEYLMDDVEEEDIVQADVKPSTEASNIKLDIESINALADADENEDDYSFLSDE